MIAEALAQTRGEEAKGNCNKERVITLIKSSFYFDDVKLQLLRYSHNNLPDLTICKQ